MDDILQAALEAGLNKEAFYVKAWGKWVNVWELDGDQLGNYFEQSITEVGSGKKAKRKMNYKVMRTYLTTLATHYPAPDCLPDKAHPHYNEYPGAVDEQGNTITPAHPKAGELVFSTSHVHILKGKGTSALGQIAEVAMRLSGITDDEEEEGERKNESGMED